MKKVLQIRDKKLAAKRKRKEDRKGKPKMCVECDKYPADPPGNLCPGCHAYKDHTAV